MMPTVDTCPAGQRKVPAFSSPECGTYYRCEFEAASPFQPSASPLHTGVYSPLPVVSPQPSSYQSPYPSQSPVSTVYPSETHAASPLPYQTPYNTPYYSPSGAPVTPAPVVFSPQPTYSSPPTYSPAPTYAPQPSGSPVSSRETKSGFLARVGASFRSMVDLVGRWFSQ